VFVYSENKQLYFHWLIYIEKYFDWSYLETQLIGYKSSQLFALKMLILNYLRSCCEMMLMGDSESKAKPNPSMLSNYVQHAFQIVSKYMFTTPCCRGCTCHTLGIPFLNKQIQPN
jgi:hypothetical protein